MRKIYLGYSRQLSMSLNCFASVSYNRSLSLSLSLSLLHFFTKRFFAKEIFPNHVAVATGTIPRYIRNNTHAARTDEYLKRIVKSRNTAILQSYSANRIRGKNQIFAR